MKKKIKKAFNVNDAQNGALVETKDGKAIRILCYDRIGGKYPIVALLDDDGFECCVSYTTDGELCNSDDFDNYNNNLNLIIVDEIETKFDEGNYIVSDIGNIYEITEIDEMYHTKQLSSGYEQRWTIEDIHRSFHKWSLNDAKPGSVLCCEDGRPFMFKEIRDGYPIAYFGIASLNIIYKSAGNIWTRERIRPATYKEYNSLFKQLKYEGYEYNIDTHEITKQEMLWRNDEKNTISGYYIQIDSCIVYSQDHNNKKENHNIFATKKQSKAALAMARISQIMDNDKRFGGVVTDEDWIDKSSDRWVITRYCNTFTIQPVKFNYMFLAFHNKEQAQLFLKENEDLIKDYYMLD